MFNGDLSLIAFGDISFFISSLASIRMEDDLTECDCIPYKNVAVITSPVPRRKFSSSSKSWNTTYENKQDKMIEIDVAKPFRILSAYLMTAATSKPPDAYKEKQLSFRRCEMGKKCFSRPGASQPAKQPNCTRQRSLDVLLFPHHWK